MSERLPEAKRNALLREVDWRFLLRQRDTPLATELSSGSEEALSLVTKPAADEPGSADLVALGRPSRSRLDAARKALRPGGEVACVWRMPVIAGPGLVRRRLERAGFSDVRVLWPGPLANRRPQFWLGLGSPKVPARLLAMRPPRSRLGAALRPLWRACVKIGMLAPLYAIGRAPGERAGAEDDDLEALLPGPHDWLLLTEGGRSINKVVAVPFPDARTEPSMIVKFARVAEAEAGLTRETEVLRLLERERPDVPGIPRLLATDRRAGRIGIAETAISGEPLILKLSSASFRELAAQVTEWLLQLAEGPPLPAAPPDPHPVLQSLKEFEHRFAEVFDRGEMGRARQLVEGLQDLPPTCEHRDCAPWNVLLADDGAPALLDWESAQPNGVPLLDLVYFLANAVFVLDGALDSGRTRQSYARLLDPSDPVGRIAAECLERYAERTGIGADAVPRLRLLCWIVHCASEYRHVEAEVADTPGREDLGVGVFAGLVREELNRNAGP